MCVTACVYVHKINLHAPYSVNWNPNVFNQTKGCFVFFTDNADFVSPGFHMQNSYENDQR